VSGFDADDVPIVRLHQNHTTLENTVIPQVSASSRVKDSYIQFEFRGKSGLPYLVLSSTNLTDWSPIGAACEAGPGHFRFRARETGGEARRFYKTSSP